MYNDVTNSYGQCNVQNLPYDGYAWNTKFADQDVEQTMEDIKQYRCSSSPIGCFFKVDFEYHKELHDIHKDYPMEPELQAVNQAQLSDFMKENCKSLRWKVLQR